MEQEIIDRSRVIAEFMDVTFKDVSLVNYPKEYKQWEVKFPNGLPFEHYGSIDDIISKYTKYHSDWGLIMPVYGKAKDIFYKHENILKEYGKKLWGNVQNSLLSYNIGGLHDDLYRFILWYNSQAIAV